MALEPRFTISPLLLSEVEQVAVLRERIQSAVVDLPWIPALQKDTRSRNVHASTAIEGNPLTLEQVRALEEGRELSGASARHEREVLNYFAGLRYVEKNAAKRNLRHADVLKLHRILAGQVMDQGEAGQYRTIPVRVGPYRPPPASAVSGLMSELLEWWTASQQLASALIGHPAYRLRRFIHLPTATAARAARSHCGNSTGAASTPITSSRWTSTTGKTGPPTTPRSKACARRETI
jgi:hypothetical protein